MKSSRRNKVLKTSKCKLDDCQICSSTVRKSHSAFECNFCERWVHCGCDKEVPKPYYEFMRNNPCSWFWYVCPVCRPGTLPCSVLPVKKDGPTLCQPGTVLCSVSPGNIKSTSSGVGESHKQDSSAQMIKSVTGQKPKEHKVIFGEKLARLNPENTVVVAAENSVNVASRKHGSVKQTSHIPKQAKITEHRQEDKQSKTKSKSEASRSNCLILFNVPVCSSSLLEQRALFDQEQWSKLCSKLGLDIQSAKLCRLYKGAQATQSKPPPLRVTLGSAEDAENILLLSQVLALDRSSDIRIRPDRPWAVRQMARQSPELMPSTSMVIHSVPELATGSASEKHLHDVRQWRWLSSQMTLGASGAISICRLPRPTHLTSISSPRLLAVKFSCQQQLTTVLQRWYETRGKIGGHIRCCESRPRTLRKQQAVATVRPQASVTLQRCNTEDDSQGLQSALDEPKGKNEGRPVPLESAN